MNEPAKSDLTAEITPSAFEVYVGSFAGPSYGLWWDGAALVYESFLPGYAAREQERMLPSNAAWTRFWMTIEGIGVWEWRDRYHPGRPLESRREIRDGTHWSVTLAHGGRRVESSGDSAGPGSKDLDESRSFGALMEAVSRLVGGRPFR